MHGWCACCQILWAKYHLPPQVLWGHWWLQPHIWRIGTNAQYLNFKLAWTKLLKIHLPTIDVSFMLSKRFALLSENYFLIPLEYLVYYPSLPISFTKHVQCCFFVGIMHKLLRFWFAYVVYSCEMLPNLYWLMLKHKIGLGFFWSISKLLWLLLCGGWTLISNLWLRWRNSVIFILLVDCAQLRE